MLNRTKLLLATTALVATVPLAPAMAEAPQGFAGTLSGEYSHLEVSGGDANSWGASMAKAPLVLVPISVARSMAATTICR